MIYKIINYLNAHLIGMMHIFFPKKKEINISIKKLDSFEINSSDKDLFLRLFNFYKLMKNSNEKYPSILKPSTLWEKHINNDYKFLLKSLDENNIENFAFFLNNFGNWNNYLGIEHNILIKRYSKNIFLRNFLKNEIFYKYYEIWRDFGYSKDQLQKLATPEHGNQPGAYLDGNFVTIGSFFNHIISKILFEHIKDKKRPIICELGGGYGKLGNFLIKNFDNSCFIDFDLPEVLVLAAYYLMKTFPQKQTLLYGEKEFKIDEINNFDLIFLPAYEIKKMSENSVDLFINKNSLGEMKKETTEYFINKINLCSKIFFHMNHNRIRNIYKNGETSLISSEYPINLKKFDLIFDYPDLSHFIYTGRYESSNDIFMKLYKLKVYN